MVQMQLLWRVWKPWRFYSLGNNEAERQGERRKMTVYEKAMEVMTLKKMARIVKFICKHDRASCKICPLQEINCMYNVGFKELLRRNEDDKQRCVE